MTNHLVLAGGGHTHALVLRRWGMNPQLSPKGLITLINRNSTNIYSSMFSGLIAREYSLDETSIDLRNLCQRSGVSFVKADIEAIDIDSKRIILNGRPSIIYDKLSLNIGLETANQINNSDFLHAKGIVKIKPLEKFYMWVINHDKGFSDIPITIVGSGLASVEIAISLKKRWPERTINLCMYNNRLKIKIYQHIISNKINFTSLESSFKGFIILCTGSYPSDLINNSGFKLDRKKRILTSNNLKLVNQNDIFAAGDCATIYNLFRPPSGVFAVRSAKTLARNIEKEMKGEELIRWRPQSQALQLLPLFDLDNQRKAILIFRDKYFGPNRFFWELKRWIDLSFISKFLLNNNIQAMDIMNNPKNACRGCAAKLPEDQLRTALNDSSVLPIEDSPKDSVPIGLSKSGNILVQSVDGFPALISDPWLNGKLTTLHASSDIWARGASVVSAQSLVKLPAVERSLQKKLLFQTLSGIKAALDLQGASLVGGHTTEARTLPDNPFPMSIGVSIVVNGEMKNKIRLLDKYELRPGDELFLSRPIGSGIIFAGSMTAQVSSNFIDNAISILSQSQHNLFNSNIFKNLYSKGIQPISACTDITGFGLLGHLIEMLKSTNKRRSAQKLAYIKINLLAENIPAFKGAKLLSSQGYMSTLSEPNKIYWNKLSHQNNFSSYINLVLGSLKYGTKDHEIIKNLIIDPQTCGPLLVSCPPRMAIKLELQKNWHKIGIVDLF